MRDGETRTPHLPPAWQAQHAFHQLRVLLVAGVGALLVSWRSPVLEALLVHVPSPVTPWGFALPTRVLVPLLFPLVVGLPLALTRHRAPLLLFVALVSVVAATGVLEVARLNWVAFAGGVAFRVEAGPVPVVRSLGGLALVLCGVLLLAQQSVHHHVALLAQRGVPRNELALVRRHLLQSENLVVGAGFIAGAVLLLVVALSMGLSERAPAENPWFFPALAWIGLLLGVTVGVIAVIARTRRQDETDIF